MVRERRDIYQPERPLPRPEPVQKIKKGYRILIWVALCAAVVLLGAVVSRLDSLAVTNIVVRGNHVVPTEKITALVESQLSGSYLSLFSRRNIVLFPKDTIEQLLLDENPRFSRVDVERHWRTREIIITVDERSTAELVCTGANFVLPCYAADDRGYVFDTAPQFSGKIFFAYSDPTRYGEHATSSPLGSVFLPQTELERVASIASEFGALFKKYSIGYAPIGAMITPERDYSLALETPSGTSTLLFKNGNAESLADILSAVVQTPSFKNKASGTSTSHLLYLDLRFGKKAYYKFASSTRASRTQ